MDASYEMDLVAQQRFLLRLAARLAGPEAAAEDLVQDAYVRALERPPRVVRQTGPDLASRDAALRAWLATVVRRGAGRVARVRRRRDEREQRAALDRAGEVQRAADQHLEAATELLELLRDLPSEERTALTLRYAKDLTPKEIARALAIPVETVRSRLRRGRQRLRQQLDRRHGDRAAWLAWLAPRLRPGATPAQAGLATSTLTTAIVMGTTTKLLAGAAACALVIFAAIQRGTPSLSETGKPRPPAALAQAQSAQAEGRAEPVEPAVNARELAVSPQVQPEAPTTATPPSKPWPLLVRALGTAAAGAAIEVRVRMDTFLSYESQPLHGELGADNTLSIDVAGLLADAQSHAQGARVQELIVALEHPDLVPARANLVLPDPLDLSAGPPQAWTVDLRVGAAAVLVGKLVDEARRPPNGSNFVAAFALGRALATRAAGSALPGEDGSFRLRIDGEGHFALLALARGRRPATLEVDLARGREVDLGEVALALGEAIEGRAVGLDGAPVEDQTVLALLQGDALQVALEHPYMDLPDTLAWFNGGFQTVASHAECGPDGTFRISGLGRFRYELDVLAPGVDAPLALPEKLVVEAPARVELRPQAAELLLTFDFPPTGVRAGYALWTCAEATQRCEWPEWWFQLDEHGMAVSIEVAGPDGKPVRDVPVGPFVRRLAMPPNAQVGVSMHVQGMEPVELRFDTPDVGGTIERRVSFRPSASQASLSLRLRGSPVSDGAPFVARIDADGATGERALEVQKGMLQLDDLGPGRVKISVTAGTDRFAPQDHLILPVLDLDLASGEERVLELDVLLGGSLILEAFGAQGERLNATCELTDARGERVNVLFNAQTPTGRIAGPNLLFSHGPSRASPDLLPGRYRARLAAKGHQPATEDLWIEAGRTTHRSVTLRPDS